MEVFGELDSAARQRVWGTTFGSAADFVVGTPGQRFMDEFRDLETRLHNEVLERLRDEKDLQRRAAAYRFPQQFHALGPLIEQFMDTAFIGVPGAPEPMLRGAYFTSGTQEGNPIDRVLGMLTRSFNLERGPATVVAGGGKSFFVMRLLRQVIFPESGLASSDRSMARRAHRTRMLTYGGIALASLAAVAAWTYSYVGNRAYVDSAQAGAAAVKESVGRLGPPRAGDEADLVKVLNQLRTLPGGYRDQLAAAATPDFGLSQSGKIGTQALRAYRGVLQDALFPRLALALEGDLREALRTQKREALAETLEAYINLYEGAKADPRAIEAAARRLWRLPDAESAALLAHLRAGLEGGAPEMRHPRDEAIIREARGAAKRT
jgi:type VI secretion system protein ImpL